MKFSNLQKRKFGTLKGAYSKVTETEHADSQITLTDEEVEIVTGYFGIKNILTGNVKSNPSLALKEFKKYPSGETAKLNIVFPKLEKTELRLYLSSSAGFKPLGGEIWFIFNKDDALWIGSMQETLWKQENALFKEDETDSLYQEIIYESREARKKILASREIYARTPALALARMEMSGYKCEYDEKHSLFISRTTGRPYLESHHLIPMAVQEDMDINLDNVGNIFCLCPNCHRAIHHGEEEIVKKIINKLVDLRRLDLELYSVSISDIYSFYSVETIV